MELAVVSMEIASQATAMETTTSIYAPLFNACTRISKADHLGKGCTAMVTLVQITMTAILEFAPQTSAPTATASHSHPPSFTLPVMECLVLTQISAFLLSATPTTKLTFALPQPVIRQPLTLKVLTVWARHVSRTATASQVLAIVEISAHSI